MVDKKKDSGKKLPPWLKKDGKDDKKMDKKDKKGKDCKQSLFVGAVVPFKSDKQRKFFNINKGKLENSGVNVEEWNKSSKGKKLPKVAPNKKK